MNKTCSFPFTVDCCLNIIESSQKETYCYRYCWEWYHRLRSWPHFDLGSR